MILFLARVVVKMIVKYLELINQRLDQLHLYRRCSVRLGLAYHLCGFTQEQAAKKAGTSDVSIRALKRLLFPATKLSNDIQKEKRTNYLKQLAKDYLRGEQ